MVAFTIIWPTLAASIRWPRLIKEDKNNNLSTTLKFSYFYLHPFRKLMPLSISWRYILWPSQFIPKHTRSSTRVNMNRSSLAIWRRRRGPALAGAYNLDPRLVVKSARRFRLRAAAGGLASRRPGSRLQRIKERRWSCGSSVNLRGGGGVLWVEGNVCGWLYVLVKEEGWNLIRKK